MSAPADTPLSPGVARLLVGFEKYGLPVIYALLAWQRWQVIRALPLNYRRLAALPRPPEHLRDVYFTSLVGQSLLLVLLVFIGLALLLNRPARELPTKLGEVLVPLVAGFYFVLYALIDRLPDVLRFNLLPETWQPAFALAGVACSALGYAICLWSLFHLRRSFAVFVSVREVVTCGPYRYVRHPIYLGYFLDQGGLVLANGSLGMGLLAVGFVMFQVHRASLEEAKLGEASLDYRRYVQQTGFMWPRWR